MIKFSKNHFSFQTNNLNTFLFGDPNSAYVEGFLDNISIIQMWKTKVLRGWSRWISQHVLQVMPLAITFLTLSIKFNYVKGLSLLYYLLLHNITYLCINIIT